MEEVKAIMAETAYQTELTVRGHQLRADEPDELGGADTGPTPGEYLCMALASCKSITMRMYAERKDWPLNSAEVKVSYDTEWQETDEGREKLTVFKTSISLRGELDEAQSERLVQIASKCPVHKILEGESRIDTELH